jgi:DNA-binding XRE family transcriptional regulator
MGDIERGEKNVTLVTADKLAKALGTPLSSLFLNLEQDPKL